MKHLRQILAILTCAALLLSPLAQAAEDLPTHALAIYNLLAAGDYASVAAQFDAAMSAQIDAAALQSGIESTSQALGPMTGAKITQTDESARAAALLITHESGQSLLQIAFDESWQISGLYIQIAQQAAALPLARELPEGAQAQAVTLFAGTERALAGELILPANSDADTPCAVLVQGSGPSDMNETVGANQPLRDLAYDLAALGVGSLRFDKITYAAPAWPVETVEQEYLEPVAEALKSLRERTQARRVYLIGHSEGGMLAPYLVDACGFDGGIALAGTPKQLWEISRAQNLALLEGLDEEQREAAAAQIEEQTQIALMLPDMSDEEAAETRVFGMSAIYLRHLARMDQAEIARDCGKAFLFLWGEEDAQVDREAFGAWEERLGDGPYTYITYEGLNHLFIPAQEGENISNISASYAIPSRMDERVARDIANWMAENSHT